MDITVKCLGCGHRIELDQAYDSFQGEMRCWVCHAIMEVAFCNGKLAAMVLKPAARIPAPDGVRDTVVVVEIPDKECAGSTP